jgi:ornithine--oxo-acid transaminase
VRGRGLFLGIEFSDKKKDAWNFSLKLLNNGMIAKPTHDNIIRFAPPLVVTDSQTDEMIEVVKRTWKQHNDD